MSTMSTSGHLKRPQHPSPVPSYVQPNMLRSGANSGCRSNVLKRARWDIPSPMPSPPVLSIPLPPTASSPPQSPFVFSTTSNAFQFQTTRPTGHSKSERSRKTATGNYSYSRTRLPSKSALGRSYGSQNDQDEDNNDNIDPFTRRRTAFSQLRRSTRDHGEVFVEKMREWELTRHAQNQQVTTQAQGHLSGSSTGHHQGSRTMECGGNTNPASHLSPASPSISSSSASDGSSVSRKRSYWSLMEDHADADCDAADMDWEVVLGGGAATRNNNTIRPFHQGLETDNDLDIPISSSSSSSQHGDAESSDEEIDDDDDDLIFVLSHNSQDQTQNHHIPSTPGLSPSASILSTASPDSLPSMSTLFPSSTDKILSDLSQIMAAGAGSLDTDGASSDFIEIEYGSEPGTGIGLGLGVTMHDRDGMFGDKMNNVDAGAFWE